MARTDRQRYVQRMRRKARKKRAAVIERDGANCHWCKRPCVERPGEPPTGDTLTLDHIIELEDGGDSSPGNLVVACGRCNNKRASQKHTRRRRLGLPRTGRSTLGEVLSLALGLSGLRHQSPGDEGSLDEPAQQGLQGSPCRQASAR